MILEDTLVAIDARITKATNTLLMSSPQDVAVLLIARGAAE